MASVVEDAMSSEDLKNVIFRVYKDDNTVELIGINNIITYKVQLEEGSYTTEIDESEYKDTGYAEIQVKSKELNSFLDTFKSVRRTRVTDVEFETVKNKVKVTVKESDVDTGHEYSSNWVLDNIPIKPNMLSSINLEVPKVLKQLDVPAIGLYVSSLFPVMQNGANLYSKLAFGENSVVAFSTSSTTMMRNFIGDDFTNFCLSYRALSFIKGTVCAEQLVEYAKTDERICFKMGNSVAFVRYEHKMPNYEIYEKMINRSHAIVLDRQYFKDVLKRLSLIDESIVFTVKPDEEMVEVKNSKFNQEIPILQQKAMSELGTIAFKVLPKVFTNAIIGDDNAFSNSVFMYIEPLDNGGYSLTFSDDSGSWNSVARIR
jgi:hypothetical protein